MLAGLLWKPVLTGLGNALVEDEPPHNAQTILVLGGDDTGNRIAKAAELAAAGYAPYILVSGPLGLLGPESEGEIEYARRRGYPVSLFRSIPLPKGVNSTRTETAYFGKYFKEHGIHSVLLVTSNYHTGRAGRLMRRNNPWLNTIVVAAPDPFFTPGGWWKLRDGQKTFLIEWLKTIATSLGI